MTVLITSEGLMMLANVRNGLLSNSCNLTSVTLVLRIALIMLASAGLLLEI